MGKGRLPAHPYHEFRRAASDLALQLMNGDGEHLRVAREYLRRGWRVIPVPYRSKRPILQGWQRLRLEEQDLAAHFGGEAVNVGVLLGEPSGWLIDIDLDHPRAVALADQYLPRTPAVFGRQGKPCSHRIYRVTAPVATKRYRSKSAGTTVELRSTGAQTVFPPSTHESGEPIVWEDASAEPSEVDPDELLDAVKRLADAVKVELGEKALPRKVKSKPTAPQTPEVRPDNAQSVISDSLSRCLEEMLRMQMADQRDGSARLFAAACRCVEHDLDDVQAIAVIRQYATQRPFPRDWTDEQILQRLRDAEGKCTRGSANGPASDHDQAGESGARETQSAVLVRLAEAAELFHFDDEAYASISITGHRETHSTRGKVFRTWLTRVFYEHTRRVPGHQALQDALGLLRGRAVFDGPVLPVAVRMAELEGAYWIDLGGDTWQAVRIDPTGWQVVASDAVPVRFVRRRAMRPLPVPVSGGSIEDLRRFVNLRDENDWALLLGWLVAALRPGGPYAILNVLGEQGTAKSTLCRVLRALVDPNKAPLRSEPREARDLMITAANPWLVILDNLSGLPPWLSDALCRLATGGGFATRELYTDADEVVFDAMRPVVINGIDGVASRPDLLDRCVTLTLEPIDDDQRQTEAELWAKFEPAQPRILGALLSAVSVAMRRVRTVKLPTIPRMADFALWATAAEPGLGLPDGAFLRAYAGDRAVAHETVIENSPVGRAIVGLTTSVTSWRGTQTELLAELNTNRRTSEQTRRQPGWPGTPRKLGSDLRRLAPSLRAVGISVVIPGRRVGRKKRREILLERAPAERSAWSAPAADVAQGSANAHSTRTVADRSARGDGQQQVAPDRPSETESPNAAPADHADHYSPGHPTCPNEFNGCTEGDSVPHDNLASYAEAIGGEEVFDL